MHHQQFTIKSSFQLRARAGNMTLKTQTSRGHSVEHIPPPHHMSYVTGNQQVL